MNVTNKIGTYHKFPSERNRILDFVEVYQLFVWDAKQKLWKVTNSPFKNSKALNSFCRQAVAKAQKNSKYNVGVQILKTSINRTDPSSIPDTQVYFRGRISNFKEI